MESAAIPVIIIVIGTAVAFFSAGGGLEGGDLLNGLFGVGMAAVGMLSTLGLTLATDAYGPVADNAGRPSSLTRGPWHPIHEQHSESLHLQWLCQATRQHCFPRQHD